MLQIYGKTTQNILEVKDIFEALITELGPDISVGPKKNTVSNKAVGADEISAEP